MVKSRVGVRLKEAVGGKKSHNRSQDLVALTERYNGFCKRLHALIDTLKKHYASMHQLNKTRLEVCFSSRDIARKCAEFRALQHVYLCFVLVQAPFLGFFLTLLKSSVPVVMLSVKSQSCKHSLTILIPLSRPYHMNWNVHVNLQPKPILSPIGNSLTNSRCCVSSCNILGCL